MEFMMGLLGLFQAMVISVLNFISAEPGTAIMQDFHIGNSVVGNDSIYSMLEKSSNH